MVTETFPAYLDRPRVDRFLAALMPAGSSSRGARRSRTAGLLFDGLSEFAAEEGPQRGQYGQQRGQRQQHGRTGGKNGSAFRADYWTSTNHPKHDELGAKRDAARHGTPASGSEQRSENPDTRQQA